MKSPTWCLVLALGVGSTLGCGNGETAADRDFQSQLAKAADENKGSKTPVGRVTTLPADVAATIKASQEAKAAGAKSDKGADQSKTAPDKSGTK